MTLPKWNSKSAKAYVLTTYLVTLLITATLSALQLRGNIPLDKEFQSVLGTILAVAVVLSLIIIVNKAVKTK